MRIGTFFAFLLCIVHVVQSKTVTGAQFGEFGSFMVGHQQDREPVRTELVALTDKVLKEVNSPTVTVGKVQLTGSSLIRFVQYYALYIADYPYKMEQLRIFEEATKQSDWNTAGTALLKIRSISSDGTRLP